MFKLVIADDEGKTTVVPLVRDEITVGRKEGNTIRLTERNVSRRHARLKKANGAFVVEDLSSYNGVKVNGRRIGNETVLKAGDQITIGDYQLALQLDGADAPTLPEATAPMAMPGGAPDAPTAMVSAPPVQPGPPARLVMMSPPAPGAEFAIGKPIIRIGRAEELDIWVNHRSISREHAEISRDEKGVVRLRDLGSANGVRLNGSDVQNAELSPGDVIELGQVRFRFVGAGEHFQFDADRTMQLDAVPPQAGGSSRAPLYAAVGIVLVAVAGGIGVAMSGDPPESTATEIREPGTVDTAPPTTPDPVAPTPAPVVDPEAAYRDALSRCETQFASGDYAAAAQAAAQALAVRPGDAAAQGCTDRVQRAQTEAAHFTEGLAALQTGDLQAAFLAFEQLPRESSYRQRDEVRGAMRSFATTSLDQARAMMDETPDEAQTLAEMVASMTDVDPATRRSAQALVAESRRRSAALARAGTGGRPPRGGGTAPGTGGRPPRDTSGGGASSTPAVTSGGTGGSGGTTRPPTVTPESGGGGPDTMAQARQCLGRGDTQCAIRALSGARDPDGMALLIQIYRDEGNLPRALDMAEQFVRRFPTHRRTQGYRQFLSAHGR